MSSFTPTAHHAFLRVIRYDAEPYIESDGFGMPMYVQGRCDSSGCHWTTRRYYVGARADLTKIQGRYDRVEQLCREHNEGKRP